MPSGKIIRKVLIHSQTDEFDPNLRSIEIVKSGKQLSVYPSRKSGPQINIIYSLCFLFFIDGLNFTSAKIQTKKRD